MNHGTPRILCVDGRTLPQHFDLAVLDAFRLLESRFAEEYDAFIGTKPG